MIEVREGIWVDMGKALMVIEGIGDGQYLPHVGVVEEGQVAVWFGGKDSSLFIDNAAIRISAYIRQNR